MHAEVLQKETYLGSLLESMPDFVALFLRMYARQSCCFDEYKLR